MEGSLSVTLLTLNDQDNLKKCLQSVKDFADEIIVAIDAHTTDDSRQVALRFTKKVFLVPHKDNFHLNKRKANAKARGDWVLQMDSDEFVTKELAEEIKLLKKGQFFGFDSWQSPLKKKLSHYLPFIFKQPIPLMKPASAYFLPRKNFFLKRYLRHTGQYPDPVIRLFRRGRAYLPGKDVHEQMVVDGPVGWLTGDLDHYATPYFSRYLLRENRYSSLEAEHLKKAGVRITPLNTIKYMFIMPKLTFLLLFFRYRGFLDGFPGFVFSLFSGLHHALSYMKLWELYRHEQK